MTPDSITGSSLAPCTDHLRLAFHRIGWDASYTLKVKQDDTLVHLVDAFIDMDSWKVQVTIPGNVIERLQALDRAHDIMETIARDGGKHMLEEGSSEIRTLQSAYPITPRFHVFLHDFLAGIAYHEFGHSKECPVDVHAFSAIMLAISTALERKKRFSLELQHYIMNLFTDLIINIIHGLPDENAFFRHAMFTHHASETTLGMDIDLPFCYFVLLNCRMYQQGLSITSALEELVLPSLDPSFDQKLSRLTAIFCPTEAIATKKTRGDLASEDEQWSIIEHVSNRDAWPAMAYEFTTIMLDILPETEKIRIPVPDTPFVRRFKSDPCFHDEVLDEMFEQKFKNAFQETNIEDTDESIPAAGTGIPRIMKPPTLNRGDSRVGSAPDNSRGDDNPRFNEENLDGYVDYDDEDYDDDNEDEDEEEDSRVEGERYPGEFSRDLGFNGFSRVEFLKSLYKHQLRDVQLGFDIKPRNDAFPITHASRSIMGERDDPTTLDPMMVFFLPGSTDEMMLYKKELPIFDPNASTAEGDAFPDLVLLCDDSGSMDWNPLTMDGRYDALVVTMFSLMSWLSTQSFAPVIEYNFAMFSSTTRSTGWIDFFHLEKFLELLFFPQQGGTELDADMFKEILKRPKKKAIILITDGVLMNEKEIGDLLSKYRDNVHFFMVQIGRSSSLSKRVKNMGFPAQVIRNVDDLSGLVLTFAGDAFNIK
ncbi:MAG: hypothetical protein ACTSUE_00775 [Promethearchaeota archaeon]